MNNKGFTLVELLAVLVILMGISMIAVGGISASLEKRDIKECEEQKELAIGAAKIYFSLNNVTSVTVSELKYAKYIDSSRKVDRLSGSDVIKISSERYVYTGTNCG